MTTRAKAKTMANKTFIVQASLTILTYDCQNIFIAQATVQHSTVVMDSQSEINFKDRHLKPELKRLKEAHALAYYRHIDTLKNRRTISPGTAIVTFFFVIERKK
jgi:hypothetical protein